MAKQNITASASDNNNPTTPKRGRRKAPASKANTRTKITGGANMKLLAQANKAIDRATKILGKIKFA